ncbi:hypothetical protein [Variovorax sp. OV329]|uniref:hypothetical protein n=1 Tax=Variovorax sp. OV329 TaxID=1882825 RepID=UPI0008F39623|nr:hypothetical protein [Variovorax sp. OV329]SFN41097.1 hypothetical protein SAMN05444747_12520 [Variovorax sp. OV329]
MSRSDTIEVQLQRPFSVGGTPVGRVCAWLLAAIAWRSREGGQGSGLVSAHEVAAQLQSPSALPMALTRLFASLQPLDLALGWGSDPDAHPGTLALRGRSRGPFWLDAACLARLRFRMGEQDATPADLERFVGLARAQRAGSAAAEIPHPGVPDDLDRWYALLDARQRSEEEGGARHARSMQSLAELRLAPHERLARAWSRFYAARSGRRAGDVEAARRGLRTLVREMGAHPADPREQVALALARIGLVWCDHQSRRLARAEAGLRALSLEAQRPGGAVWRVNSRIACEFHNLRALVMRARLVEGAVPVSARPEAVRGVLADLREALICATESDAFTLLESVAANLGYTLWLLEAWLPPEVARQGTRLEAIRWILLGEWLCQRHGLAAGSPWNLINVCRVARGAGQTPDADSAPALALARVREKVGVTAALLGPPGQVRDWIDLSAMLAESALAARTEYTPAQQAAALVEHGWQLAGAARRADFARCREQALRRLPGLVAMDQRFFRRELERAAALAEGA